MGMLLGYMRLGLELIIRITLHATLAQTLALVQGCRS